LNGTWAWVCSASTYSPGFALGCTSVVTVASVLSAGADRVPVLIGPGKASGVTFTGDLKSGQSRWHWIFSSTFFPASTSTHSSVGETWNGAGSRTATTSCRIGRLELSWVFVETRVYGRTSRINASSPRFEVAVSLIGPTQSGASASAQSTTTPRLSLLI